ncbi:alcohol dehydrogenase, partial [Leucosporidium creatinivorum]
MFEGSKRSSELREAADRFAEGTLKPIVDQVYAFEDAHKAYERSMSGRAKGKVVISV